MAAVGLYHGCSIGVSEPLLVKVNFSTTLVFKGLIKTSSSPIYWDLWNGFVSEFVYFILLVVCTGSAQLTSHFFLWPLLKKIFFDVFLKNFALQRNFILVSSSLVKVINK